MRFWVEEGNLRKFFIVGFLLVGNLMGVSFAAQALKREGTQVLLSAAEIADLKQWVENAKTDLSHLEDEIAKGTLEDRRSKIVREFEAIVGRSGAKENELLMRYVLNRALAIDEMVGQTPAPSEMQSLVAFLGSTVQLAKSFYTDDQKYLEAVGPQLQTPMALFAYQYSEMLLSFSRTFLRPELEYKVTFSALGWLGNDLNSSRNLLRIQFADSIGRIARLQTLHSENPAGDDQALLKAVRQFKFEYRERVLKHILEVNSEIRESLEAAARKKAEDARLASMAIEERERERRDREAMKLLNAQEQEEYALFTAGKPEIEILEASFARNVAALFRGNMTKHLRGLCNGKQFCNEKIWAEDYGDPAPHVYKDFEIIYRCGPQDRERRYYVPSSSKMNAHALRWNINCYPRFPGKIHVRSASYGYGDNNSRLDITSLVQKSCFKESECEYILNVGVTGDPMPGVPKTLRIEYVCNQKQKSVVFESEHAHNQRSILSCRFVEELNK
jgi:hypothetical protein